MTLDIGSLRQRVTLEAPTTTSDGAGGYVETWVPIAPSPWWAAMQRASQAAIEKRFAGTVIAHASYIFNGRFHPGITMQTRLTWTDRAGEIHVANVLDLDDVEGAGVETIVLCSEITT